MIGWQPAGTGFVDAEVNHINSEAAQFIQLPAHFRWSSIQAYELAVCIPDGQVADDGARCLDRFAAQNCDAVGAFIRVVCQPQCRRIQTYRSAAALNGFTQRLDEGCGATLHRKEPSSQCEDCTTIEIGTLLRSALRQGQQLGVDKTAKAIGQAREMLSDIVA